MKFKHYFLIGIQYISCVDSTNAPYSASTQQISYS